MTEEKEHAWHDTILPLPAWFVLICGLLYSCSVNAQPKILPLHIYEGDGVTVSLMPAPCVDQFSLRVIRAEKKDQFKAIESVWRMSDGSQQDFAGCWVGEKTEAGEEAFFLIFNDGQHFLVLKSEFNRRRGQVGT